MGWTIWRAVPAWLGHSEDARLASWGNKVCIPVTIKSIASGLLLFLLAIAPGTAVAQNHSCPAVTYNTTLQPDALTFFTRNVILREAGGDCSGGHTTADRSVRWVMTYNHPGRETLISMDFLSGPNTFRDQTITCNGVTGTSLSFPVGTAVTCTFSGRSGGDTITSEVSTSAILTGTAMAFTYGPGTLTFTPPPTTATLSDLAPVVGLAGDQVTMTFSASVADFDLGDLALSNLTASNLQTSDNRVFTFDVVASGDGVGSIALAAGAVNSARGFPTEAAAEVTTNAVASRPEATFNRIEQIGGNFYRVYFNITNPGRDGVAGSGAPSYSGATYDGGTLGIFGASAPVLVFEYGAVPTGGPAEISFPDGFFRDAASGNTSLAAGPFSIGDFDLTPPDVEITGTVGFPGDSYPVTITFSEPVNGFEVGDITRNGATISGFVNTCGTDPCAVFTATVTAGDPFTHSLSIAASVAQDAAGNDNTASNTFGPPPSDGTAPFLRITGVPDGFTGPTTATITFDWGEDVFGFSDGDISVTGGALGPISGGRQVWTAELTVDGDTDVVVIVGSDAVRDATGTFSLQTIATGAFASGAVAEEIIRDFLAARGQALIAAQPDLAGLLGDSAPTGNIQVTRGQGIVQMRTGTEGPVWAAVDAQWSDLDGFRTAYTHLTFGAHTYLQDETLLGVMLQVDHAASSEGVAEIEGTGWLIGPYYVARYGGVVVDARVLWGQTENEIAPLGTYTDTFGTDRVLAMLNLSGEIELQRATLRPLFGWAYTEDRSEAYIDALSNPVAAQRVRLSEVQTGVDWVMPIGDGGLDFTGGLTAIFTAEEGGNADLEGGRGRIDLGLRRAGTGPLTFDLGVYADGLGQSGLERYGANVSVDWRF